VRYIKLAISSAFERTLIYRIISYLNELTSAYDGTFHLHEFDDELM